MSDTIVCKIGGSSIYEIEKIKDILIDDPRRRVIIPSAPGQTEAGKRVTDMLIELAETKDSNLRDEIVARYQQIFSGSNLGYLSDLIDRRLGLDQEEKEYLDSIKAIGEEGSARELAKKINALYIDPKDILVVDGDFGNAKILRASEDMIKKRLADTKGFVVIPGFYGYTKDGRIMTFSRGGSDLTGAYIAASLDAMLYEKFTNKDGVFAADPNIVENPAKISELTFEEMRDLSYSGFDVFHPEAMEPVARKRIPVHIRNTFNYPAEGTHVVHDRLSDPKKPVIGVAYKEGFCSFNIRKLGLNDETGIGRKILGVFERKGISYEFSPTGIDDISVVLREEQVKDRDAISDEIHLLVGKLATVEFREHLGCLAVAGKGIRNNKRLFAEIGLTLIDAGIDIIFPPQGVEKSLIYVIDSSKGVKAVNVVHDRYLR